MENIEYRESPTMKCLSLSFRLFLRFHESQLTSRKENEYTHFLFTTIFTCAIHIQFIFIHKRETWSKTQRRMKVER